MELQLSYWTPSPLHTGLNHCCRQLITQEEIASCKGKKNKVCTFLNYLAIVFILKGM